MRVKVKHILSRIRILSSVIISCLLIVSDRLEGEREKGERERENFN